MRSLRAGAFVLAGALFPPAATAAGPVPTPESFLGWKPGEDRKLADWTQVVGYFKALDAASDRVLVEDVGRTTEGRPFLVVTISSEANLLRREEIRRDNLKLADARALGDEEAERLIGRGKAIVALNHGIHSTEVAATLTSLETAYTLATANDPSSLEILDRTIVLLLPSHNPDGTDAVTTWYRASLGKPWEGGEIPFLYHPYAGHDNNRDWYAFTQVESRLTAQHVYDRWRPQVVHDLHQMGGKGARMFVPPYVDPYEPNVDPALVSAIAAVGSYMAARLTGEGKAGVVTHALFDGFSPARAYPHTHGGVRILSEGASAKMATPLDMRFDDLERGAGYDPKAASWNFPRPWSGGTWRLRDVMDYQRTATRALLEHVAGQREYWLRMFHGTLKRAASRSDLFAYVVRADQDDVYATTRLLEILRLGGVELHRARAAFTAGGKSYAALSHVVRMQQPFSAFAKTVLERQRYPDLRQYPGGPPTRPYDVTAHTLPLLMGVAVESVETPFVADLEPIGEVLPVPGRVEGKGREYALGHTTGELKALGRLLEAGVAVGWAETPFIDRGQAFPAGTLLVPASGRGVLAPLTGELGITARAVLSSPKVRRLRKPRVGLYRSHVASMDEGWTRFVFEKQMGVAYETLRDKDVIAGRLSARFDAIVLPDQPAAQILSGHPPGSLPDEYTGGLGKAGAARLKEFVEAGGTLIALDSASLFAIDELGLGAKNALAGQKEDDGVFCPGALLRVQVDGSHPLTHGLAATTPIWFESSPAFDAGDGRTVLRYEAGDPLLSGWLLGGPKLEGKSALVDVTLGKGHVVLFGFRPQYRAQSWGTYIPLLNAIYLSAAAP